MVKLFPMAIDGVVELFGEVLLDLDERTKKAVYCYLRKPPFPLVDLFIKHARVFQQFPYTSWDDVIEDELFFNRKFCFMCGLNDTYGQKPCFGKGQFTWDAAKIM